MNIQDFFQTKVPFLKGLKPEQIALLIPHIQTLSFKKGQTILFKGASVDGVHVVAEGKASVHLKSDKNKGWVQVAELNVGEIFGETSIVEYKMAGATIKAAADMTKIYVIMQGPFLKTLHDDPELKERMIQLIKERQAERHKDGESDDGAPAASGKSEPPEDASAPPADEAPPA